MLCSHSCTVLYSLAVAQVAHQSEWATRHLKYTKDQSSVLQPDEEEEDDLDGLLLWLAEEE